ncbi:DNA polymerase III subunit delta [Flavobacterium sp. NST-5]|uniref:DNA polymerase III subunit delta n=1 Tax=Flavobacterium ichthyis TaxID=2698827 RepID=A0ABW9ZCL3_9FLAO|nr:DNA polymerase III subunit delta [Flavobacterium ichthyis]NBL65825.1 DNA polymerase III subunit delta [Flavobacterium ichthyis]
MKKNPLDEPKQIIDNIKAGNLKPIYFFMGEEPYFIDKLTEYLEDNLLSEDEKGFNQTVLYGRDVSIDDIVSTSKRYPMMAEKQVVIVKEAQNLSKTIDNILAYAENPTPSTVLVMAYKYKTLDKRKKTLKAIDKNGLVYESQKLKDYQVGDWLKRVLQGKKIGIEPKAAAMLVDFLGNDLSKIANEIDKLAIILKPGEIVTPQVIEENIGFSKDFNVFELRKAIAEKKEKKAFQIIKYFAENPKDHPIVLTTGQVFAFFVTLLKYHGLKDKNPRIAAPVLGVNPFFMSEYEVALKTYPMRKVSQIIGNIREMDMKSKGVGAANVPQEDLLKEMLVKIFN